ncbi:hypothetical protein ACIP3B_19510 [Streptomyces anulatus]
MGNIALIVVDMINTDDHPDADLLVKEIVEKTFAGKNAELVEPILVQLR